MPEWAGYDAVPQDQREFPGLTPVRSREARARDGRVQGSRAPDGYPPAGPGYPPGGPRQPRQDQSRQGQHGQGQPGQGQAGPGQAPWQGQPWPPSQGPARSVGEDPVGEDPVEAFAERWRRRGIDPREDQRAGCRKRRRLLVAGGVVAVVIAVAVYFFTGGNGGSANLGLGSLVTTFLPGELQQVPNACTSVPGATLAQYLPGQLKMAAPPLNAGANSQCTWTLDKAPLYRVLEVNMQAYSPSGLASGDGSATFAAEDAYAELETAKQNPGPRSGQPKATVTDLPGMPGGADTSAFEAAQVFDNSGAVTDVATVVVRYRNVIVTVVMNGLDHANKGNYGPVSPSLLSSAAQTVARQVTGELVR